MRRVWLLAAWVALLAACGRKGPPLPPLIELPETTTGLWAHQELNEVVLTWKYPALTRSGRSLTDLDLIEIYRMEVPPGQEQAGGGPGGAEFRRQLMLARAKVVAKLRGEGLRAATRGENLEYRENLPPLEEGKTPPTFWYALRTVRRDGTASVLSNIVSWQRKPIPPPVTGLAAKPTAEGIVVSWDEIAGLEGVKYVAERRAVPGGSWDDIGPQVFERSPQLDSTARQGLSWRYRIRAMVDFATGPISEEVEVEYKDVYPPPPPSNFICLPEPGRVRMRWDASPEAGVTYKVFRRKGDGPWVKLTEQASATEFTDAKPQPGEREYAVKAVDAAGNESEALYCKAEIGP